jgi:hypothetical protein
LCRGSLDEKPEDPLESDLAPRVTVAERDLGCGGSFLRVSSVAGISICMGEISGSRRSYGPVPKVVFGRCSISGLEGCVVAPTSGGKGETGCEVSVSFLGLIAGGAADGLTVPSLKSCSKGCSATALCCVGREPAVRLATPWEGLRSWRVCTVSKDENAS